jgi:methylmalonyl-CoA mutase cobalamin-binding domain/chain
MNLSKLYDAVLSGDAVAAKNLTVEALAAGVEPLQLVNEYMSPAMGRAGTLFEEGEYFVPQLLLSARAMKSSLALVRPLLAECGEKPLGRVVIGTVQGDLHDIGKNIVAAVLEGGGFEVVDLGVGVSPEKFVEAIREFRPQIVGMSSLLTATMLMMKETVEFMKSAGVRSQVKVLIGGAPVTRAFAEQIGADDFGGSATHALRAAKRFIGVEAVTKD